MDISKPRDNAEYLDMVKHPAILASAFCTNYRPLYRRKPTPQGVFIDLAHFIDLATLTTRHLRAIRMVTIDHMHL